MVIKSIDQEKSDFRPLNGWKVLVPRSAQQAASMSKQLRLLGAFPAEVPTISIVPPQDLKPIDMAVRQIAEGYYQWLVVTSINAVNALEASLRRLGLSTTIFDQVKIACVGIKTANALEKIGIRTDIQPSKTNQHATGLVEIFPQHDARANPTKSVLLPRADIATQELPVGLQKLGWQVDDVIAYSTALAPVPSQDVQERITGGDFDAICFTSASTVRNLVKLVGRPHKRTVIACIGSKTAYAASELGIRVDVIPEISTVPHLIEELAKYVQAGRID
ncbi:uroporphyrinogen-III synthase [Corynebacterium kutscheri]|uniref:Uroporphyrinogen-III synthase n=1 Tax=Corynebacterium kutscheri TaxID=35755 RepID=A0A0F6TCL3_9CORY|nr:uroporphyrinogen-III synthase [Corynebacterium kutscheri]AKE40484.1 uroporphyrinogen-III synthase [Corynebacterium kutscheri]VEH10879.1 uroporphyrin-III C-methyltransferase [Corynebacterium kutscheri]